MTSILKFCEWEVQVLQCNFTSFLCLTTCVWSVHMKMISQWQPVKVSCSSWHPHTYTPPSCLPHRDCSLASNSSCHCKTTDITQSCKIIYLHLNNNGVIFINKLYDHLSTTKQIFEQELKCLLFVFHCFIFFLSFLLKTAMCVSDIHKISISIQEDVCNEYSLIGSVTDLWLLCIVFVHVYLSS